MRTKYTQFEDIKELDYNQKLQIQKTLAKRANVRMKELEKHDMTYYAYEVAEHYLKAKKRKKNRFYEGKNFKDERDLDIQLANLTKFLNSQTSTVSGMKKVQNERIATYKAKGIDIKDPKSFFDFLGSRLFTVLSKYVASDQIIEDFSKAADEGIPPEAIQKEYEEFLNSDMTFEQIDERRKGKKLLK